MLESRALLGVLIVLNTVVLAGQVWPAGAPPFARWVNIGFLVLSLTYFVRTLAVGRRVPPPVDRGREG